MTNYRKICRQCRQQVKLHEMPAHDRLRKERGLSPQEFPVDGILMFRCPTHGLIEWHQITHGEPGSPPPAPEPRQTSMAMRGSHGRRD